MAGAPVEMVGTKSERSPCKADDHADEDAQDGNVNLNEGTGGGDAQEQAAQPSFNSPSASHRQLTTSVDTIPFPRFGISSRSMRSLPQTVNPSMSSQSDAPTGEVPPIQLFNVPTLQVATAPRDSIPTRRSSSVLGLSSLLSKYRTTSAPSLSSASTHYRSSMKPTLLEVIPEAWTHPISSMATETSLSSSLLVRTVGSREIDPEPLSPADQRNRDRSQPFGSSTYKRMSLSSWPSLGNWSGLTNQQPISSTRSHHCVSGFRVGLSNRKSAPVFQASSTTDLRDKTVHAVPHPQSNHVFPQMTADEAELAGPPTMKDLQEPAVHLTASSSVERNTASRQSAPVPLRKKPSRAKLLLKNVKSKLSTVAQDGMFSKMRSAKRSDRRSTTPIKDQNADRASVSGPHHGDSIPDASDGEANSQGIEAEETLVWKDWSTTDLQALIRASEDRNGGDEPHVITASAPRTVPNFVVGGIDRVQGNSELSTQPAAKTPPSCTGTMSGRLLPGRAQKLPTSSSVAPRHPDSIHLASPSLSVLREVEADDNRRNSQISIERSSQPSANSLSSLLSQHGRSLVPPGRPPRAANRISVHSSNDVTESMRIIPRDTERWPETNTSVSTSSTSNTLPTEVSQDNVEPALPSAASNLLEPTGATRRTDTNLHQAWGNYVRHRAPGSPSQNLRDRAQTRHPSIDSFVSASWVPSNRSSGADTTRPSTRDSTGERSSRIRSESEDVVQTSARDEIPPCRAVYEAHSQCVSSPPYCPQDQSQTLSGEEPPTVRARYFTTSVPEDASPQVAGSTSTRSKLSEQPVRRSEGLKKGLNGLQPRTIAPFSSNESSSQVAGLDAPTSQMLQGGTEASNDALLASEGDRKDEFFGSSHALGSLQALDMEHTKASVSLPLCKEGHTNPTRISDTGRSRSTSRGTEASERDSWRDVQSHLSPSASGVTGAALRSFQSGFTSISSQATNSGSQRGLALPLAQQTDSGRLLTLSPRAPGLGPAQRPLSQETAKSFETSLKPSRKQAKDCGYQKGDIEAWRVASILSTSSSRSESLSLTKSVSLPTQIPDKGKMREMCV